MMRNMLEERFALKVHREIRSIPVYALTMARPDKAAGPGLVRVERNCTPPVPAENAGKCGFSFGVGRYRASGQQWSFFVGILEDPLTRRPIVDRTGLSGQYDITLEWNPDISRVPESVINPPTLAELEARPVLFTAMREQLGLKMDQETAPYEVIVIDSVSRPAPD